MLKPIMTAALTLWVVGVGVMIILQRRSAAATLAWLLVLAFLPIAGLVMYRLIGPQKLEHKRLRRVLNRRLVREAVQALTTLRDDTVEHRQLAHVGMELGEASPLRAGDVDVFLDGASAYAAILAEVAAARHHIHVECYIWKPDTIGTQLRDRLAERARAGIRVRIVVDASGSSRLSKKFLAPLRAAGAEIAWFNPIRLRSLRVRRPDFRTHRKIVVCDGRVGFQGGMNIADVHSALLSKDYWRDTHMRVTGAAVWPLQRLFIEDWTFASDAPCPIDADTFPSAARAGEHLVQIVGSGPDSDAFAIHKVLFTAINQATERVWLTTAYFVPDEALVAALVSAGLRNVDVRLIVPKKGDSQLVDLAARSYFSELLSAGVRVFEYEARFIHAKTMVCDRDIAMIGSANLDNRSFRLNFEVAAVVFGETVNGTLAHAFIADLRASRELNPVEFQGEALVARLGQATARLISPLL